MRKQFQAEYETARKVINRAYIPFNDSAFVHAFRMLKYKKSWVQLKKEHPGLQRLTKLVFQYTARVRNVLLHGAYYPFEEGELLLLVHIDKLFVQELEKQIEALSGGKAVLSHTPRAFGAGQGRKMSEQDLSRRIRFAAGKRPLSCQKAQEMFWEAKEYL